MFELIRAFQKYDPVAPSAAEIFFLYPGYKAIGFHRVAHFFYRIGLKFVARAVSECSRFITGIDIHPGAKIGRRVIIDHGMGTVVGETAEIGDDCLIFQGVTLGGVNFDRVKRHPTLRRGVVVGAGAKILGNIVIGESSRVGANSVVIKDVPPNCTATGIPAKVVSHTGVLPGEELKHDQIEEK